MRHGKFPRRLLAAAAGVLAIAASQAAAAQTCDLAIQATPTAWTLSGYDPFVDPAPQDRFTAVFTNTGETACRFSPTFETTGEPFGLAGASVARVPYSIVDDGSGVDLTPALNAAPLTTTRPLVTLGPGERTLRAFILSVDDRAIPGDGRFDQRLRLTALDESGLMIASQPVVVGLDVQPSAVMGLAGRITRTDQGARIDLGELQDGRADVPVNLTVRSTRGFEVAVQSRNNGRLMLAGTDWAVGYELFLGGRRLPLSGAGGRLAVDGEGRAMVDRRLPLAFDISGSRGVRAGTYADLLTFEVTPR